MNRSGFFQKVTLGTLGAAILKKNSLAALLDPELTDNVVYIGQYTSTPREGISQCRFNPLTGSLALTGTCEAVNNPSFLIFGLSRGFLYAVNETGDFGGQKSGSVSAFAVDQKTGKLTFLNSRTSRGAHPCHLTIDRTGKYVLVANYTGGNVTVLPVMADGRLGEPTDMVRHSGSGPNTSRQEGPHAHSVNLSPDNRFAFVCDLGIDKIMIYRFDQSFGKLAPAQIPFYPTAPGAGPRHFTFSNDGSMAFLVNELNSTLTCFSYHVETGALTELATVSTLPESHQGENTCADIHCHPDGRYVYASNRGADSIAVFSVQMPSGKLKLIQNQPTMGKTPRNFAIHPSGRYLLAANQNSDLVTVLNLDPVSGMLTETGNYIQISKPVCLLL